jgi:RecA/RadA recombinase
MTKAKMKAKAAVKAKAPTTKAKADPLERIQPLSGKERQQRLEAVTAKLNKTFGRTVIQQASEMSCSYLLRRPTGILSLDIALGGGFPASAPVVIVGPDGAGKDYMLWRTAAETQKIYGDDFAMAVYFTEFLPDKKYMKDKCGLKIAMSDAELNEEDVAREKSGLPLLTDEERAHYKEQVGSIYIVSGVTAEHGFDAVMSYVESNTCQIVAVNSIGFLQTEAKEEQESFTDFAQQRNEAILLSKFAPKLSMYLNRGFVDERNETSIILINQVRSKDNQGPRIPGRPVQDKDKYRPAAEAHAMKHGKAIELMIHNGKKHFDEAIGQTVGREKNWEITKGKLGTHEGIRGSFDYFYDFGADTVGDLVKTCKSLGVLEGTTWLTYEDDEFGFKANGEDRARQHIQETPGLIDHLRTACLTRAKVVCRYR